MILVDEELFGSVEVKGNILLLNVSGWTEGYGMFKFTCGMLLPDASIRFTK